ncbi:MAG: extracellular solute-binding protein [Methylococcales bacterium]|nr:extracellular solute-binding protein [Methylococcales bacterium]
MTEPDSSRRRFLQAGLTAAAITGFPAIVKAINRKPTIKVVGTHVTLQETLRRRAEHELGINIEFYPGGSAEVLLKASTDPDSFDLYEQWSNSINVLWRAGTIQPIDIARLTYWPEINALVKTGRLTPQAPLGAGDAPCRLLYAQPDGSLSDKPSGQISFMPYVHNVDSYGYHSGTIEPGIPYQTESWGWLLDDRYRGKVALVNEPTIGLFDAALAVKAKGLMDFDDIGNLSRSELDQLFDILIRYKKNGHFRGAWSSVPQSVAWMKNGQVVIQSMFSPGVSALNGLGIPCIYAAPKEGYRAWYGVMCLSKNCSGERQDAAYAYMNWWLSGWPGAFIARQGYYIANPERARQYMSAAEWAYWYQGEAASELLPGTDGRIAVQAGDMRTGGSYQKRFANIAVWNTVMPTYEYSLLKWNQFNMTLG